MGGEFETFWKRHLRLHVFHRIQQFQKSEFLAKNVDRPINLVIEHRD